MKTKLQRNCLILSAILYAIVIYLLCLLCSCAGRKPDPWTKADTAREVAFLAMLAGIWRKLWQYVWIGIEGAQCAENASIGIGWRL